MFWVLMSPLVLVPLSLCLYCFLLPTLWPVLVPYLLWCSSRPPAAVGAKRRRAQRGVWPVSLTSFAYVSGMLRARWDGTRAGSSS